MTYIDYLKTQLPSDWFIGNELVYDADTEKTYLVVNFLQGSIFNGGVAIPTQLTLYTNNVEIDKTIFDNFAKTHHNKYFNAGLDSVKQTYTTSILLDPFNNGGQRQFSRFLITGTLVITGQISDIEYIEIDGLKYETDSRVFAQIFTQDTQSLGNNFLTKTENINTIITLEFNWVPTSSPLNTKLKSLERGLIDINTEFDIGIKYTDEAEPYLYKMKCISKPLTTTNNTLPIYSLKFIT